MKTALPLPKDKKLNVLFRVEPGCLGPRALADNGASYVEAFCCYAQKEVDDLDADFVHWDIVPRFDKSLPEMEYRVNNKKLNHDQAERYLKIFNKELDEFEDHLNERLGEIIESFLGQQ